MPHTATNPIPVITASRAIELPVDSHLTERIECDVKAEAVSEYDTHEFRTRLIDHFNRARKAAMLEDSQSFNVVYAC